VKHIFAFLAHPFFFMLSGMSALTVALRIAIGAPHMLDSGNFVFTFAWWTLLSLGLYLLIVSIIKGHASAVAKEVLKGMPTYSVYILRMETSAGPEFFLYAGNGKRPADARIWDEDGRMCIYNTKFYDRAVHTGQEWAEFFGCKLQLPVA
jgi:hypothetical protein